MGPRPVRAVVGDLGARASWLSLQLGQAIPPDIPLTPAVGDADPIDLTAAIVAELDLVITVDSMLAHLAGALGRPVLERCCRSQRTGVG